MGGAPPRSAGEKLARRARGVAARVLPAQGGALARCYPARSGTKRTDGGRLGAGSRPSPDARRSEPAATHARLRPRTRSAESRHPLAARPSAARRLVRPDLPAPVACRNRATREDLNFKNDRGELMAKRWIADALWAGLAALCAGAACAQTYPAKPVRIVTAPAGGGNDFSARLVARGIGGPLGQQVIVDNRPTILGPEIVSKAAPDGYTLLLTGSSRWIGPLV